MKIAYLGPRGTFSDLAFEKFSKLKKEEFEAMPLDSIFAVFTAISEKKCDKVLVPIENSLEGSVTSTFDLLASSEGLFVEEEFDLAIVQNLLGKGINDLSEITDIISHPQPLAQCREYLNRNFSNVDIREVDSTAIAAEMITESIQLKLPTKQKLAVVGSKELAKIYDLDILAENINDNPNNKTRFFIISKVKTKPTGDDKTSIVFSALKDKPGGLYEILGEFANREINLTMINSRPTKEVMGDYLFFIDFLGHADDPKIKSALEAVKEKASFFKLLGSYKVII